MQSTQPPPAQAEWYLDGGGDWPSHTSLLRDLCSLTAKEVGRNVSAEAKLVPFCLLLPPPSLMLVGLGFHK